MPLFVHDGKLHAFMHIPKAAGASVESWLRLRFGRLAFLDERFQNVNRYHRWTRTSPQHVTAADLDRIVPRDMIASSFAVTRHPFTRLVSAYQFSVIQGILPARVPLEAWFRNYASNFQRHPFAFDNHLRPQVAFHFDDTRSFKLEDGLDEVTRWLNDRFGAAETTGAVPKANVSADLAARRAHLRPGETETRTPLSDRFLDEVRDFYAEDFERFGYDPDLRPADYLRVKGPIDAIALRRRMMYGATMATRRIGSMVLDRNRRLADWSSSRKW
jgi:hypothetical protein